MKKLLLLALLVGAFTSSYGQNEKRDVAIEEVVIVGYGESVELEESLSSVARLGSESFDNPATANFFDAIAGKLAGLSVITSSGAPNRLRGVGSINATSEPLIVIDGISVDSRIALMLNVNDIESVTVLKDATASSIYGARGANGVIFISTKRGSYNSKPQVTFSSSYSLSSPVKSKLSPMSTQQHTTFLEDLQMIDNATAENMRQLGDYDWQSLLFNRAAPTYQANLSVSGGSDSSRYYFSTSYFDSEGVTVGSEMDRFTFRLGVDSKISSSLKAGASVALGYYDAANTLGFASDTRYEWFVNPVIGSIMIPSYQNPYDDNGEPLLLLPHTNNYPSPLMMDEMFPRSESELNISGSLFLEYKPLDNLTVRSQFGGNGYLFTTLNGVSPLYPHTGGQGELIETTDLFYTLTFTNSAEYNYSANLSDFGFLLGYESIYDNLSTTQLSAYGITDARYMNIGAGALSDVTNYNKSVSVFSSLFTRLNYNYNKRYFAELSLRRDASSRFGEDNRNALFYSVGAMWRIKSEEFMQSIYYINNLDLRASYGTSGNASIGNYQQYATMSNVGYGGSNGWRLTSPGNSSLGWEHQSAVNLSLSGCLFDKVNFVFEYYNRTTSDMLLDMPVSITTGFTSQLRNVGSMRNSGVDVSLGIEIFNNRDWSISLATNFNYNNNTILELYNNETSILAGDVNILSVGHSFGTYYMKEWLGVNPESGEGQYNDGEGGVATTTNVPPVLIDKSWIAPYSGGLTVNVAYKKFSLIVDGVYALDRYLWNRNLFFTENIIFLNPVTNQSSGFLDYWKEPGDNSRYPSLEWQFAEAGMGGYNSSHTLENASYFRLKNLEIGYTVNSSIRLWASARNLFTISPFRGFDSELDSYIATDDYPNSRQFTLGIELKF